MKKAVVFWWSVCSETGGHFELESGGGYSGAS